MLVSVVDNRSAKMSPSRRTAQASGVGVLPHQLDVGVHHLLHQLLQRDATLTGYHR